MRSCLCSKSTTRRSGICASEVSRSSMASTGSRHSDQSGRPERRLCGFLMCCWRRRCRWSLWRRARLRCATSRWSPRISRYRRTASRLVDYRAACVRSRWRVVAASCWLRHFRSGRPTSSRSQRARAHRSCSTRTCWVRQPIRCRLCSTSWRCATALIRIPHPSSPARGVPIFPNQRGASLAAWCQGRCGRVQTRRT